MATIITTTIKIIIIIITRIAMIVIDRLGQFVFYRLNIKSILRPYLQIITQWNVFMYTVHKFI